MLIGLAVFPPIIPEKKTYAVPTNAIAISTRRIVAIIPEYSFHTINNWISVFKIIIPCRVSGYPVNYKLKKT
ncbi:MAG: hypothetical protein COW21_02020 [Candidatus Aenigmarchaeota archaeon CG15_BIG_FIL_POST_REV_8_21_14_020_37_27]|nr:MAG: hypothetical protein COW21_02020 [Candidatus Aenigmarchaeota archaeon CG15_BIG_FIL_POST_REV_8_21_14_020_37_27]